MRDVKDGRGRTQEWMEEKEEKKQKLQEKREISCLHSSA